MVHAQLLRRIVRAHLDDPAGFAQAWDEGTEQLVGPFYQDQIKADRTRLAAMTALRDGREWSPPASIMGRLIATASYDADVFRALMETVLCLALPEEVIERPGIREQIEQSGCHSPPPAPGPEPSLGWRFQASTDSWSWSVNASAGSRSGPRRIAPSAIRTSSLRARDAA